MKAAALTQTPDPIAPAATPIATQRQDSRASRVPGGSPETIETACISDLPALEHELATGVLRQWKALTTQDPLASCFQSPGWCMPWYRIYHNEFDPFVVAVTHERTLVGVVPLAVHRARRTIIFASGDMADYRDIVAAPEWRAVVMSELLSAYLAGRFPNPLQIGWIDPASDTPALVAEACRARGLRLTSWHQPCYRWFPPPPAKPSAQKFLNWYKRQGAVSFEIVDSPEAWRTFRDDYYRHHTLRQIQAGRPRAFDDPRHKAFYDQLFESDDLQPHVTAFRVNGSLLAGHFGFVWRDTLLFGPPSIRLEDEQRSPAVILLSWIIQNAEQLGLRGLDLTVGDSDFKKRLGSECVYPTMLEVYGRPMAYYGRAVRAAAIAAAKSALARMAGPDAWRTRVKPALERLQRHLDSAREEGLGRTMRQFVGRSEPGREAVITPATETGLTLAADERAWEVRDNRIDDLLLAPHGGKVSVALQSCAQSYSKRRTAGATLHTLLSGGRLAAWCYAQPARDESAVRIDSLYVLPEWRARGTRESLVNHVARRALAEGADRVVVAERG